MTTTQTGPNTYTRQQFSYNGVANVIPTNRLTQVGKNFISYYPLPNAVSTSPAQTGNYLTHTSGYNVQNEWSVKVDYNINEKNMLFARYSPAIRAAAPRISLARTLPALSVWCT